MKQFYSLRNELYRKLYLQQHRNIAYELQDHLWKQLNWLVDQVVNQLEEHVNE